MQAACPFVSTACQTACRDKSMTDTLVQIDVLISVTESMAPALQDLLNKLNMNEESPVACVVYDFSMWWVGCLGKKLGIPAYIFFPMSASFYSYLLHIPDFVSEGRLPLGPHTDLNDKSNMFSIPGSPSLHVSEVPDTSWDPNPVCSFDYVLQCGMRWRDATGMLLNTVYELEEEAIEALMRKKAPEQVIKAVGPILPDAFLRGERSGDTNTTESAEAKRWQKWLDEQPDESVLYVAFGTIACLSEEQVHELAKGIEVSKERFLWVVRIPDRQQVEKAKQTFLPSGFELRTEGRGVVLWELAPQRKILAHRAIGGFLTHCGWNSTLEAVCKGVPMLCCPMFGDQVMNGKWVSEMLQTSTLLKRNGESGGTVSEAEVVRAVQEVMHTKRLRLSVSAAHAREVASHAALDPSGSSHKSLHAFVQSLVV